MCARVCNLLVTLNALRSASEIFSNGFAPGHMCNVQCEELAFAMPAQLLDWRRGGQLCDCTVVG